MKKYYSFKKTEIINENDFRKRVEDFCSELSDDIVKIKPTEIKVEPDGSIGHFTFQIFFDLKDSKGYVKLEEYETGSAVIYLADKFYEDAEKFAKKYFGEEVNWNNTRCIGWIIVEEI